MTVFQAFRDELGHLTNHRLSSHDQGDVRANVTNLLAPHEMELAGEGAALDASMSQCQVGDLSVVRLRYGSDVVVRPAPATGFVMLQFVLSGTIVVEHDGLITQGTAGQGLIIESLDRRLLRWSKDCEQLIIPVRRSLIARAAETLTGRPSPARYDFDRTFNLDDPAGRSLMALVKYLISMTGDRVGLATPTADIMGDLLAQQLFLNHRSNLLSDPQTTAAPHHVVRAEKFMRANISQNIDLHQLAEHANVSTRTLCASFRRFRSASPMEWLRNYRLDQVRAWLQSGQATTIAHVASRAGFTHAGRFSQVYRARFGESPNRTLASLNGE